MNCGWGVKLVMMNEKLIIQKKIVFLQTKKYLK